MPNELCTYLQPKIKLLDNQNLFKFNIAIYKNVLVVSVENWTSYFLILFIQIDTFCVYNTLLIPMDL